MDNEQAERFAALWASAQPTVSAFIRSVSHNFQQSDEILQRVAVALVRKFDRYDPSRPFAAWAIGVAKYEVLYYRRERMTDRHLFDDELVERISQGYQRFASTADPFREALEQCMTRLDGRARRAIELRYAREMNFEEAAREMHMKAGAVRMLLCRTRQLLRECIERRLQRAGEA
jgi:RNA polymerase sigma-70 factor (ECF subfamily)